MAFKASELCLHCLKVVPTEEVVIHQWPGRQGTGDVLLYVATRCLVCGREFRYETRRAGKAI